MTTTDSTPTTPVGIVVVSHSEPLARAAVDLTLQMVETPPPIAVAAGTDDGFGTNAIAVAQAVHDVARRVSEGVLVLMDLGSAVLSAEMALELADTDGRTVLLSPAPLVEGLVGAVVRAAAGAGLDEVATEAAAGIESKRAQLGGDAEHADNQTDDGPAAAPRHAARLTLSNPLGLHMRPAAAVVAEAGRHDAAVTISLADGSAEANAASVLALVGLRAVEGSEVVVTAVGQESAAAVEALSRLIRDGFGELTEPTQAGLGQT